jgi:hypothetical protein
MDIIKFLILFDTFCFIDCYFEISLTSGQAIIKNDTEFMNFDKLRVKKFNRSGHVLDGEIELFVEIGNDYEV